MANKEMLKENEYERILSPGMNEPLELISFEPQIFTEVETMKMTIEDSEYVGITDINKYKMERLKEKAKSCYAMLQNTLLSDQILLTKRKFHAAFPTYYDICP